MNDKKANNQRYNSNKSERMRMFRERGHEKVLIIVRARKIEQSCNYEFYDGDQEQREFEMKELMRQWKQIGSAGDAEEKLWNSFSNVNDRFWKGNRLAKLNTRITEMTYELEDMQDRFGYKPSQQLGDAIDRKEDKIWDLQWEAEQIEKELGIERL